MVSEVRNLSSKDLPNTISSLIRFLWILANQILHLKECVVDILEEKKVDFEKLEI